MTRLELLQRIIDVKGFTKYCELGTFTGWTLDNIKVENRLGVDISPGYYPGNHPLVGKGTDDFFKDLGEDVKYELIFIDADHSYESVYKDINNSLKHLEKGGIIVLHDMNPKTFQHTTDGVNGEWNGDCYKVFSLYGGKFPFTWVTVDTDQGMSILIPSEEYTDNRINWKRLEQDWDYFDNNRKEVLHLISIEEFKKLFDDTR